MPTLTITLAQANTLRDIAAEMLNRYHVDAVKSQAEREWEEIYAQLDEAVSQEDREKVEPAEGEAESAHPADETHE